jgi:hypothetical protein
MLCHGQQAEAAAGANTDAITDWTQDLEVGYRNGLYAKTTDGNYSLKLHFLFQPQFEYLDVETSGDVSTFSIKRGQIRLFGHFFDPRCQYRFMMETPGIAGGTTVNLRDAWVDWKCSEKLQIRAGQMLVPFDHENLQPSWALQFVDRSVMSANLGFERDLGIDLHGQLLPRLQYHAFVMNGDGRNQVNTNTSFITGCRLNFDVLGETDYFVSDLENSRTPHLSVGVGIIHDNENERANGGQVLRLTADIVCRYKGVSALALVNSAENQTIDKANYGLLGQVGCFVIPKRLEAAVRWAEISRDGAFGDDTVDSQEAGVVLTYYVKGHNLKVQTDFTKLRNNASIEGRDDLRARAQVQLFF